jgi:Acyclic terpene utilisation family protein AtuA
MPTPISVYAPLGMLGYGFPESSLEAALGHALSAFGVDAGSTDPGPYYLGTGRSFTSRAMVKRDLGLLLPAARRLGIPLVIGSAGGAGGAPHLEWTLDIVREVAAAARLTFRLAVIQAEQDKEDLKQRLARGEVITFETGAPLRPEDIDACTHIVGQMGYEPMVQALMDGAEVVLAGRAVDAGVIAAVPLLRGFDRGLALHMGKILECGSMVALPRVSDGVIAHLDDDGFVVEPADPAKRCTAELVAAHTLYEKSDPYHLHLPGGMLDLTGTTFEQRDPRAVRVTGSRWVPAPRYTIKLEGAARVGYRTICVAGARDPILIERFDEVVERVTAKVQHDLDGLIPVQAYTLRFRLYGRDGVMGALEPEPPAHPHELGVIIEAVAPSQDAADTVCALARSASLHMGYAGRLANGGNLAFPYSPAEFAAPEVFDFRVYHLVDVDNPCALFSTSWHMVNAR